MIPWNSTSGRFAYIWQNKWVGIIAIQTERTPIHFLSDVLVAVASLDLKVSVSATRTYEGQNNFPFTISFFALYNIKNVSFGHVGDILIYKMLFLANFRPRPGIRTFLKPHIFSSGTLNRSGGRFRCERIRWLRVDGSRPIRVKNYAV